jgi:hypothetical protein
MGVTGGGVAVGARGARATLPEHGLERPSKTPAEAVAIQAKLLDILELELENFIRPVSFRLPHLTERTPERKSPALSVNPRGTEVPRNLYGSPNFTICES